MNSASSGINQCTQIHTQLFDCSVGLYWKKNQFNKTDVIFQDFVSLLF